MEQFTHQELLRRAIEVARHSTHGDAGLLIDEIQFHLSTHPECTSSCIDNYCPVHGIGATESPRKG